MQPGWRFLTNHAHVLLAVASGGPLVEEIAEKVGITKRQALAILKDLEQAGYLERTRVGRRSAYTLHPDRPMRHPELAHREVAEFLRVFGEL